MALAPSDYQRLAVAVREAIEAAVATDDPGEFEYVNLRTIAAAVGLPQRELVAAARRGDFAPVLKITERTVLVRARDLRAWEQRAEVSPARGAAVTAYLDNRKVEPFSHTSPGMTMAAARKVRSHGHREAESAKHGNRMPSPAKAPAGGLHRRRATASAEAGGAGEA